jgi:hypothetical protein
MGNTPQEKKKRAPEEWKRAFSSRVGYYAAVGVSPSGWALGQDQVMRAQP